MKKIETYLQQAQSTLCNKIEASALYARNPVAHKWQVTFRCLVIRELASWRFFDLLNQVVELHKHTHILGARILLRSSIETLCLLIYCNQQMEEIVKTGKGFHKFSDQTIRLFYGSRNNTTKVSAIHTLDILRSCDNRYGGLMKIYYDLCESAHPNYESFLLGYSKTDFDNIEVNFKNCWAENFEKSIENLSDLFLFTFEAEYNEIWPQNFEKFEKWIEENDQELEKTK